MDTPLSFREALSEAMRYWEPRRLIYNAVLLAVVAVQVAAHFTVARGRLDVNGLLMLFVLAVLANVAYCACYVVDITVQLSAFRAGWLRCRVGLLVLGLAFAATLAYFFTLGLVAG